jgi:hypothetical protein
VTFAEIVTEITSIRFNGNYTASAKTWVNLNYGYVWNAADWTFKSGTDPVGTTTGSPILTGLPTDFGKVQYLYTDTGIPLSYMTPMEYEAQFYSSTSTGTPTNYTVINGVVLLGPTPNATSGTYLLVYSKGFTALVADADVPALPVEYHYILVHGGLRTGLVTQNDFTYAQQQEQFQMLLQSMTDTYTQDHGGTIQYQADGFGAGGLNYVGMG